MPGEFHAVAADLISFLPANGFSSIGHAHVDSLTSSYCNARGGRDLGDDRVAELQQGVCD